MINFISKFSKPKTIKLSEYFEIIKPKYVTLQITPSISNRNYDTELIALTIANMYRLPYQRLQSDIKKSGLKITYQLPEKVSFIISITSDDCKFYLVVPERYKKLFIEKCCEVWKRAKVKQVDYILEPEGGKYELFYSKEDALSLKYNKKTNEPLSNILNVKDIMEKGDKVDILYNFIPTSQARWKGIYNQTIRKVKKDLPVDKEKLNLAFLSKYILIGSIKIIDCIFDIFNKVLDEGKKPKKVHPEVAVTSISKLDNLSRFTHKKETTTVINTQIVVCSKSNDKLREHNNALAVVGSYQTLTQDNSLKYKKLKDKTKINIGSYKFRKISANRMSTAECNNLIQVPGRDLLQRHKISTKVDVLESHVPEELQKGNIELGAATYNSKSFNTFLPTEYNSANLALMLLAPQGAGKTNFIANLCRCANKVHESNIVIDYVKNCELSNAVKKAVNSKDVIELDLTKEECFQAFAFNEVQYEGENEFNRFETANMKAEQTLALINSMNKDGLPLTGNMRRVLNAAANIVYLHNETGVGDVIRCLEKHIYRHELIDYVNKNLSEDGIKYFEDMVEALESIDKVETETDRKTKEVIRREVVGTKRNEIDGILDRVSLLKENIYCKYMFNMSSENNIDFVKAMEEGKTILIEMPESKFNNTMVKNVLTTFFTSKVMLATKLRGALHEKPSRCNIIYDEIYQAPTAMGVITDVLSQLRKFGTKIIISAHYLDQLTPDLKSEIKGSGASYMLLQGCDKKVFNELADEMKPFELDDLLNLKQYCSLNLIRTKGGYQKFITHLPKPLF
ncbi:hypothetical protein [Clostridium coskatii]|uniref:AAA-like domain protein n=1 Tax=Clostridium coskatii TaxID=1705578 RepID=A0A162LBD8_9CLOT|nr:hypothetical protein [Clostridium coskatii]OAA91336.1 AAA-like domain protein [Clostridium coskatii]OBR93968.1 AAA-like domain protein [Clostridium coskatii]